MAAVVASKVKRKRQMALEGKKGGIDRDTQLIQRRAATASKEAEEKRKMATYYRQVVCNQSFSIIFKEKPLHVTKNTKILQLLRSIHILPFL